MFGDLNPLSPNLTKWSNTIKQFVGNLPTSCLSVFDHFVKLALKGLRMLVRLSVCGFFPQNIGPIQVKANWQLLVLRNKHYSF